MKTTKNTGKIKSALDNAKVPFEQATKFYEEKLLLKIIDRNPNPISLREEIFEDIFLKNVADCYGDGYNWIASQLIRFFYEDYPELLFEKNLDDTLQLIKNQVKKAQQENLDHAFTDFIKGEFIFSKYRKIRDLAEPELKNVPAETLSISFNEFALQILKQYEEQVEKIFSDCGFDYNTAYAYGDEKEVHLDGELRQFIWQVYNQIKH